MTQNFSTLPAHLQKMKFEMELRGLAPQTLQHYLSHLRLLKNILTSRHLKSHLMSLNSIFISVLNPASATVISIFPVTLLNSFLIRSLILTGQTTL
jgi:hypothetical protein